MSTSIRHLKLVTGEEVICDVLEETGDTIVVNNAMSLMQNTLKNGDKFFTFKTYMVYQDTPMNVIVIFTDKIMSLAIPVKEMLDQYSMAIKEMAKYIEETYKDSSNEEMSLDEFLDDMDKETRLLDSDVTGMLSN
jgi:hypothetical protein|tara:strand:- start:10825 stop:11229 length:405 start_codon:yes stop_codon:yes gene_type:complete